MGDTPTAGFTYFIYVGENNSPRLLSRCDSCPSGSIWGISSVGRALPLQGRCQEFESPILHHARLAQLVRAPALQAGGRWFESISEHHFN